MISRTLRHPLATLTVLVICAVTLVAVGVVVPYGLPTWVSWCLVIVAGGVGGAAPVYFTRCRNDRRARRIAQAARDDLYAKIQALQYLTDSIKAERR